MILNPNIVFNTQRSLFLRLKKNHICEDKKVQYKVWKIHFFIKKNSKTKVYGLKLTLPPSMKFI